MDTFLQDLKFGLKLLWKEKAYALTILATLAVCIGANTTIFSVVDNVLLEPLPYAHPDRLVRVYNSYPGAGVERGSNSAPDFFFRRERVEAFDEVAAYQYWGHTVGEAGNTERVRSMRVTPSLFPLLRVQPVIGRAFYEEEAEAGNAQVALLSHGFWRERFGANPAIVGADLRVNGRSYTIIGVLPEGFDFLGERESRFYVPIPFEPEDRTVERLHSNNLAMLARLRPGATIEQAEDQIAALDESLVDEIPLANARQLLEDAGYHAEVLDLQADLLRDVRPAFIMLWGGVAFVLLIGCLNIANLMLARSTVRVRELATRIAVGADRMRLGRQLLTEAALIGVLGGALGLAFGWAGLQAIRGLGLEELPRAAHVAIDARVVAFTFLVAVGAGFVFGGIPLVHVFRSDLSSVFRGESRTGTSTRRASLLRGALATGQVAVAFVLLIGAGLMAASLREVLEVDPGFEPESVLTGSIALPESRYPERDDRRQFIDELLREVRALPSVTAASVTSQVPFSGNFNSSVIVPEGYVPRPGESLLSPFRTVVGPGYFEAMKIPLVSGRYFEPSDAGDDRVIIIDQWLAKRYFPDTSPLGKRMVMGVPGDDSLDEGDYFTIVGVVGQIKQNELTESEHVGAYYFTYRGSGFYSDLGNMTLVARTATTPLALTGPIRQVVSRLDPELPFYNPQTMEGRVSESVVARRTPMMLLAFFAGVALFLAAIGIYGVLAYSVTQRTRELGVRMALGGSPREVFRLVVAQGLRVVAIGLVVGFAGSLLVSRLLRALLYGVAPSDPLVLATVAVVLLAAGTVACLLPARRATRIDPMVALNTE